jgi:hypothetical protein
MLSQGNRVPFRTRVPQSAIGVQMASNPEDRVQLGFRYLRLSSSPRSVAAETIFFPETRRFTASDTVNSQARLRLTESLDWYSEAAWSRSAELGKASRSEMSFVAGPALHTPNVSVRANYVSQGTGYLPLLGYYLGDRRGANVDGSWNAGPLSLHGNWVQSRNNRERNPGVPDYYSRQGGGGVQLRLPARFFVSGSVSKLLFESVSPEAGLQRNDSRQILLMVSRPIQRHNLHASLQRLDSRVHGNGQRLEFLEVEDNYAWQRLSAGAALRWQRFRSDQERQSLFVRASGQYQMRGLSLYGYWEHGKDLENSTLFATQIASTSVLGMTWEAPGAFTLRMETFRNQIHTALNPESIFLLGNRGVLPESPLDRSDDWSLFLRVSRDLSWGAPFSLGSNGTAQPEAPLLGTLAGYVKLHTMEGSMGAGDVWILTDTGQAAKTDAEGYFQVAELPEGQRLVKLDMDRLPADLSPPDEIRLTVEIRPGQLSRVDMEVTPLALVEGSVQTPEGPPPESEGIIVRLLPRNVLTTTDSQGRFGFYNLPEGDYEVSVEPSSLPENARLQTASLAAAVRYGKPNPRLNFEYEIVSPEPKPTRRVLTQRQQAAATPLKPGGKPSNARPGAERRVLAGTGMTGPEGKTASTKPVPKPPSRQARWVAR